MNRGEIGHTIRGNIFVRVAHLIDKLLFYARDGDSPARSGMFCDNKGAVRLGLYNRIANIPKIWNRLPIDLTVSSRALRPAFNGMPRDCSGSESVPIISWPPEFVEYRSKC